MHRRDLLKQCAAGTMAVGTFGLAGCGGGGGGDDGDPTDDAGDAGDDGDDGGGDTTAEPSPTTTGRLGSVGSNTVDGLAITDWEVTETDQDFTIEATVRNEGDLTTDIFDYEYSMTLYDAAGNDITGGGGGSSSVNDTEVEPGEEATITVFYAVEGSPSDVADFEINLTCDDFFSDGVYCQESPPTTSESGPVNTGDVQGSAGQNDVPELEIADWEVQEPENDYFSVMVTIKNVGDQTTDVFDYEYSMTLYDAQGNEITGGGSSSFSMSDTEAAPGETGSFTLSQSVDGSPSDVASYVISLTCDDFFSDGVYCE